MFTGLIEEVGTLLALRTENPTAELEVLAPDLARSLQIGDSLAVNGCCLTVARREADKIGFDVLNESIARTNLKGLPAGALVNLERAVAAGARLGGHFVQGHVDCATPILNVEELGADLRIEVELPPEFARYVAVKGSIALNGISLTITEVRPKSFVVWIIPHTRSETNLRAARPGDLVNLEFDILAKYVERMVEPRPADRA